MVCSDGVSLAKDRMLTYQLLSSLLIAEPTGELLEQLSSSPSSEGKLGEYLAELPENGIEQARIDIAADYAALFLGMSANPVAPYESVYTSPERLLMQGARDSVLASYRSEGFQYTGDANLPEDHLGTEFEFMAKLCEKEMLALHENDEQAACAARESQASFLRDHLLNWVPQFCGDVESRAKTGFYVGLADTINTVLRIESEEFGV